MSSMKVLNMAGAEVGTVELNDEIFGITPNPVAVHEVVKNHLANCRQGTQSALTRAEVSGGGRKPWRQKGTGHARQGSTRAPQWTHGGIVFAPKPRDYSYVLNKKVKRLALKSVLSAKAAEGKLVVIDSIKMDAIKTADFRKFLSAVKVDGKAVVVTPEVDNVIVKSALNPLGSMFGMYQTEWTDGAFYNAQFFNKDQYYLEVDDGQRTKFSQGTYESLGNNNYLLTDQATGESTLITLGHRGFYYYYAPIDTVLYFTKRAP